MLFDIVSILCVMAGITCDWIVHSWLAFGF